jgi:hypothetical protein
VAFYVVLNIHWDNNGVICLNRANEIVETIEKFTDNFKGPVDPQFGMYAFLLARDMLFVQLHISAQLEACKNEAKRDIGRLMSAILKMIKGWNGTYENFTIFHKFVDWLKNALENNQIPNIQASLFENGEVPESERVIASELSNVNWLWYCRTG